LGHVEANGFNLWKKSHNLGKEHSGGIRNGVAGPVMDVNLSSIETNRKFEYEMKVVYPVIIVITMQA
jgi:hypothetical protein